ncbi:hypothetical protein [Gilvibacter sp.]|uniref:hypothetical protein n=1 Tax=Gilvibacter sp. TaxID=2729997 RepID=UPI003F49EAE9
MKNTFKTLLLICFLIPLSACGQNNTQTQELIGTWKLDMSPQDTTDDNFAMMRIEKISGNSFEGTFYREGVKLTNGQLNTQLGIVYGALVSGDNSGSYNTTFYLKEGKLYGTTHAIDRNFLAVWIATKTQN